VRELLKISCYRLDADRSGASTLWDSPAGDNRQFPPGWRRHGSPAQLHRRLRRFFMRDITTWGIQEFSGVGSANSLLGPGDLKVARLQITADRLIQEKAPALLAAAYADLWPTPYPIPIPKERNTAWLEVHHQPVSAPGHIADITKLSTDYRWCIDI